MKTKSLIAIILCLIISFPTVSGQKSKKKITIKGIVIDDRKEPVVGAILVVDREQTRSYTDINGKFKLKISPDAESIGVVISKDMFVEKPISGRNELTINIPYEAHQKILSLITNPDEEAVNIGYGTVKQKDLISTVNKINASQNNYSAYNTIYDMIAGTVPGVRVIGKSINIQNSTSFVNASTEPLFVLDGMVVSDISSIPPAQVKSIEILKGSSAAIYGSRGANGVILITLRQGGEK
jgi:TonB-dependent starch-binding outer membrane protein SusC